MTILLKEYLSKLNDKNLDEVLSMYKKIVVYDKTEDIKKGLLRFNNPPKDTAFLFLFPKEEMLEFHTVEMKFPIDIYFFNSKKESVSTYYNVKPNVEVISSIKPSKYVIEVPK